MKGLWLFVTLCLAVQASFATQQASDYVYFPELANQVLTGSPRAIREVLKLAQTTLPGEKLEELAELSSIYVRLAPAEFLRAQVSSSRCFGVDFMGTRYVDDPPAVAHERDLRREALDSVKEPALRLAKNRCLKELVGS